MLNLIPGWLTRLLAALAKRWPALASWINHRMINGLVESCRARPHPWSTAHPYTSWTALTDQSWSARHLAPVKRESLPDPAEVQQLFERNGDEQQYCKKSTCLFPAFAQYLTDGFIRTVMPSREEPPELRLRNSSNHQIDMCPLYGRSQMQTDALRLKSGKRGERGRLLSQQMSGGEEYAPYLLLPDGSADPRFAGILDEPLGIRDVTDHRRAHIFAFGGDRTNAVPQVAMLNTLFLREHNRLAGKIEQIEPSWDDERVFQVARNTAIAIFLKIVVEEYINHITPSPFRFIAAPKVAWKAHWNRPNWITTEFSLLYRWHSLVPDSMKWNGRVVPTSTTSMDNSLLTSAGLAAAFLNHADQPAGRLGAFNTAPFLTPVETRAVMQGRLADIAPYSDYREYVSLPRPSDFSDVSTNSKTQRLLKSLYRNVNSVEFYPGLFAEDTVPNSPLPPLILKFVAVDAFSQAFTNPLFSPHVFKEETFSPVGWDAIHRTSTLADLVERNTPTGLQGARLSMTRADWTPVS